ncbi:hypothetical protein AB0H67_16100 [Streptomyces phaeochromogenes]|uniref:hypothetical protein n=1 Tax=Streptomyces phaeochromogenes TaxID=1923 RepID=UPI0033CB8E42
MGCSHLAHYLAIPPALYAKAAVGLAGANLNEDARLVVEKPSGHDLVSARELQTELTKSAARMTPRSVARPGHRECGPAARPCWRSAGHAREVVNDGDVR